MKYHICRLDTPRKYEEIARAVRLLQTPMPQAFLGRKAHEPFPAESEKADGPGIDRRVELLVWLVRRRS
jgi:hypothetical protein